MGGRLEQPGEVAGVGLEVDHLDRRAVAVAAAVGENELVAIGERQLVGPGVAPAPAAAVDEDDARSVAKDQAVEHEGEANRLGSGWGALS